MTGAAAGVTPVAGGGAVRRADDEGRGVVVMRDLAPYVLGWDDLVAPIGADGTV